VFGGKYNLPPYPDAQHLLDEAKQAILQGKKNLDRWFHDGREFIKQNNLLCL
jgi:cathepsin A (carboxypeptidase C)